jgi:hypothetical protein
MKALIISSLLLASASAFASGTNSAGSSTPPCRPGWWHWDFVDNDGNGAGERLMVVCKNGKFVALGNGAAHADAFGNAGS